MDVKETARHIRELLLQLLEGGFVMPIVLTSIDRYGSLMVAELYALRKIKTTALQPFSARKLTQ